MKRALFALTLLLITAPVHAGGFWSRLWHNADQEGDVLLQQGDAKAAAGVYADPRRKAYAELLAGDYKRAVQTLGTLHDSDADYNRGNALAHMGDLQGALRAYDAALQKKPNDKDARHNRDLVANALKQQPPKPPAGSQSQGGQKKDQQNSSAQNNAQQGQDKNTSGQKSDQAGKGQSASGQQPAEQNAPDGKHDKQSAQNGQENNPSSRTAANAQAQQPYAKNDASQARKEAAGLAKPGDGEAPFPKSEQQIEKEQWLHSIPDDPGGLLRRKFLIEHMIRQQRAEQ